MKSLENQLRTKTSLPPINAPTVLYLYIRFRLIINRKPVSETDTSDNRKVQQ